MNALVPRASRIGSPVAVLAALLCLVAMPAVATAAPPEEGNGTLKVSPDPIVLPTTTAGYQSNLQTVTIGYEGEGEVFINQVRIEGGENDQFFLQGSNCNSLANGQSCEAWLGMKPGSAGHKQSHLVVQFGERPVASFEISGDAVAPELSFEPGSYDFGLQRANRESVSTTFTVRNTGAAGLQVNSYELTGPVRESFWFGNSECSGRWLEPGETCSIQVWFYPHERTPYEAELRVSVNGASFGADLEGEGGGAVIEVESPVDFGTATAGAAGTVRTVTLRNVGNLPETFFIGVLAGGDAASFHLLGENCTLVSLSPGASCTARVLFSPDSAGAKSGHLAFFGDGEGGVLIQLKGNGVAPGATLLPSSFDFGSVVVGGRSAANAFVVRNDGVASMALQNVVLVGANVEQFAISGDGCTGVTLDPGSQCVVWARFVPRSTGAKQAVLRVSGPSGTLTAALSGSATKAGGAQPSAQPVRHRGRFARGKTLDARRAHSPHRGVRSHR
ncbi:MAG TPA: choice-of-anchor D domain-containing protein [Solirubrobacterales bacterium]|nr:choice-of-anchor D domain-containing protein [Solirubrobacterales bacterium]